MVTRCWDGDPSKRPSFDYIYLALARLRRKLNPSLAVSDEERGIEAKNERVKHREIVREKSKALPNYNRFSSTMNLVGTPLAGTSSPVQLAMPERDPNRKSHRGISQEVLLSIGSSDSGPTSPASGNSSPVVQQSITKTRSMKTTLGRSATKRTLESEDGAGAMGDDSSKFYFAKQLERSRPIRCLAVVGNEMWAGCQDGGMVVWNLYTFEVMEDKDSRSDCVTCIVYDQRRYVWVGSTDGSIAVWDARFGEKKKTIKAHDKEVTAIAMTRKYAWSSSLDEKIRVWDVKNFGSVKKISLESGPIHCLVAQEEPLEKSKVNSLIQP